MTFETSRPASLERPVNPDQETRLPLASGAPAGADDAKVPRIAYLVSRFPKLTETFVLYEVVELYRAGVEVEIFPLVRHQESVVHPEAQHVMSRVHLRPLLSPAMLSANWRALRRNPGRYVSVLAQVLWGMRRSANFFVKAIGLFPKSVYLAEEMQRRGVEHIHAHFASHPTLAALIIHRLTGMPYSFTAHGSDIHVDQTMFDKKLASASFALTVCSYNIDFLADKFGDWVRQKLAIQHCGTDTQVFAPRVSGSGDEAEAPPGPLRILCVGSFVEVKGHRYLIDACRLLRERGIGFECRLIGDGPLRGDIRKRINEAGLSEHVRILGPQPRHAVQEEMDWADVAVLPSVLAKRGSREGIPVALMEAMASGKAVVSSRQAGIPELVEDGVEGFLCPPRDSTALADALGRLARDPALRAQFGRAGRDKVVRDFDLRRNAAQLAQRLRASAVSNDRRGGS